MMHYYTNHICCHHSNWEGKLFDCRHKVTITRYETREDIYARKNTPDWDRVFYEEEDVLLERDFNNYMEKHPDKDEERARRMYTNDTTRLKPEVYRWLEENVLDVPNPKEIEGEETVKAWCTGDDSYNSKMGIECSLFFYRRSDAMNFIKEWSQYSKPVTYFNYFSEVRKELNDETGTLQRVEEFTRI